jgi:hypothetical protein
LPHEVEDDDPVRVECGRGFLHGLDLTQRAEIAQPVARPDLAGAHDVAPP